MYTLIGIIIVETAIIFYLAYFLIYYAQKIVNVIDTNNLMYELFYSFNIRPTKKIFDISNNDIESDYRHNFRIKTTK